MDRGHRIGLDGVDHVIRAELAGRSRRSGTMSTAIARALTHFAESVPLRPTDPWPQ